MAYGDFQSLLPSEAYYTGPSRHLDAAKVEAFKKASYLSQMDQFYAQLSESERQFDIQAGLRGRELRIASAAQVAQEEAAQRGLDITEAYQKAGLAWERERFGREEEFRGEKFEWETGYKEKQFEWETGFQEAKFAAETEFREEKFEWETGFQEKKFDWESEYQQARLDWEEAFGTRQLDIREAVSDWTQEFEERKFDWTQEYQQAGLDWEQELAELQAETQRRTTGLQTSAQRYVADVQAKAQQEQLDWQRELGTMELSWKKKQEKAGYGFLEDYFRDFKDYFEGGRSSDRGQNTEDWFLQMGTDYLDLY